MRVIVERERGARCYGLSRMLYHAMPASGMATLARAAAYYARMLRKMMLRYDTMMLRYG